MGPVRRANRIVVVGVGATVAPGLRPAEQPCEGLSEERGVERQGRLQGLLRVLVWAVGSAVTLCIGFALVGLGLIAIEMNRSEVSFDQLRLSVWRALYVAIVSQALLPHLLLSLLAWLGVARRFPSLERSWLALLPSLVLTAALCFPVIGWLTFTAWTPTSARDYVATLLLMAGGTAAALALPRRLLRFLAPGVFAHPLGDCGGPDR
jgi:hypothetical protein